jgi:hypothetical protein
VDFCGSPGVALVVAIREADGAADEIMVPAIKSPLAYATALHEIGHISGQHQNSSNSKTRERWAWQWARENALNWTPAMERYATGYLSGERLAWLLP